MNPAPPVTRTRVPSMGSRRTEGDGHKGSDETFGSAGEVRELQADIEQLACGVRILGGHGRRSHALLRDVLPRDSFDLGRRRKIDRRLRAFRRTFEEHPYESHDDRGASDPE